MGLVREGSVSSNFLGTCVFNQVQRRLGKRKEAGGPRRARPQLLRPVILCLPPSVVGALNSRPMQAAGSVGRPAFSWALSPFQETGRRSPLAAGFGQARAGYASAASSCRLLHPD